MNTRSTIFALALVSSLIAYDVLADELTVAIPPEDVEVTVADDGFAEFSAKETQFLTISSEPQIPFHVLKILLPPDADPATVSAAIENETIEQVAGEWDVRPVPPLAAWDGSQVILLWPPGRTIVDGRDIDIYGTDARFPTDWVGTVTPGEMRQWQLVDVTVAAFQYNPVAKTLYELIEGDLVVTFRLQPSARLLQAPIATDTIAQDTVRRVTINFKEIAPSYQGPAPRLFQAVPGTTYAIISKNDIVSRSTELERFIQSKERRGFNVQVVTEDQWGGGTGDAAAENLRSWLKANYLSQNIEYVLLIGNPDPTSGDVPMKMLWPRSSDTIYRESPSDFYYADLTGNWDLDGDGLFGEEPDDFGVGGIDRNWEVVVGRIPYYGSSSDLDRILAKIRGYENSLKNEVAWRENVLLPMKPLDPTTPGYHLGEAIKDDFIAPKGWGFHRIYDEEYGLVPPPETTPTTVTNVTNVWSSTPFGAVFWSTHGWSEGALGIMTSTAALNLNDSYPAFTFQGSCNNAWPEVNTNLAYTLLRNGGINTIGATRVCWYWPGETSYTNSTSALGMNYEYASRLVDGEFDSGHALYEMKQTLSPGIWMNFTDFNIYGDPSTGLSTFSALENVNAFVSFEPDRSTYDSTTDTTGCPMGYVGKFAFEALLTNTNDRVISGLQVEVDTLTRRNLLLTESGLIGEGERMDVTLSGDYADGELTPDESVRVPFTVCLTEWKPFQFFVNVVGTANPLPYLTEEIAFDWIDTTLGTSYDLVDDDAIRIPIGFDFEYYGEVYSELYISSNGLLAFSPDGATAYFNTALPDPSTPNNVIAPFWDDLNPSTGGKIYSRMEGSAPNRRLTVSWDGVPHYPDTGDVTFQATLYESSADIVFRYKDVIFGEPAYDNGASATVGVEDPAGTNATQYSFNEPILQNASAIRVYRE